MSGGLNRARNYPMRRIGKEQVGLKSSHPYPYCSGPGLAALQLPAYARRSVFEFTTSACHLGLESACSWSQVMRDRKIQSHFPYV